MIDALGTCHLHLKIGPLQDIGLHKTEVFGRESREDIRGSGTQVVNGENRVPLAKVMFGEMGSDESGASRDENLHVDGAVGYLIPDACAS